MIHINPIRCPKCGEVVVEDDKTLMYMVIQPPGIKCPKCGTLVVTSGVSYDLQGGGK